MSDRLPARSAAQECGDRVDFPRLRRERLARALAEMERDDLDAILLGREANVRYVSGAARLWTVGTRPFGPGAIVVREAERGATVHVQSTWDDGIPPEIGHQNLVPRTWDPEKLVAMLRDLGGLRNARRIGVDGMTPRLAKLLPAAFPGARWLDATATMRRARSVKTGDELACLRAAAALAERAFAAVATEIRPGVRERVLTGRYCAEAARLGVTIPAFEPGFCATPREADAAPGPESPRLRSTDAVLAPGDLVTCHGGVLYEGYEGAVGRTVVCADERAGAATEPADVLRTLSDALSSRCRPGASGEDVASAYEACGVPRPGLPVVQGVGLGTEPPLAGRGIPVDGTPLVAGMVIAVHAYVWRAGTGGRFARETLRVTVDGCEHLGSAT